MTRIVEWAVHNTRLIGALIARRLRRRRLCASYAIPKESDPDVPIPYIWVEVDYPGISPEDSERLMLKPLETALRSVEGIKHTHGLGLSGRRLCGHGVHGRHRDAEGAGGRARAGGFRPGAAAARRPTRRSCGSSVTRQSRSSPLRCPATLPERSLLHIARALRDDIRMIPAVLEANISGARDEQLEITIDPAKLESYGITQNEIYNAVSEQQQADRRRHHRDRPRQLPGEGARRHRHRPGRPRPADPRHRRFHRSRSRTWRKCGAPSSIPTAIARMNGQPTMAIEVTKRVGANIIDTNEKVASRRRARRRRSWPAGVHATFMFDQSTFIRDQLGSLFDSILLAILLVMIIVVAALGLRSGLLVGVAIPTSFLMGFMVLNGLGYTLNFMIMFAMLLAVGILVDGAIIVVEYADRKMTEGHPPRQAFAEAALRMFWPVVSATATMIGAFLPMLLWPGIVGSYMSYFPITLIIVLSFFDDRRADLPARAGRLVRPSAGARRGA